MASTPAVLRPPTGEKPAALGVLSLDIDFPRVGQAYHFWKLDEKPVLSFWALREGLTVRVALGAAVVVLVFLLWVARRWALRARLESWTARFWPYGLLAGGVALLAVTRLSALATLSVGTGIVALAIRLARRLKATG